MASWAVLIVGGTASETFGHEKRPWPDPGQQVSFLKTLGHVYSAMCASLGKERVIVLAGLNASLDWLAEAEVLGHPPCKEEHLAFCLEHTRVTEEAQRQQQKEKYRRRADEIRASCAELLQNGGADYDHTRLTPDTVVSVLSGRPQQAGDRVVPESGVDSVFVWFTSHGGYHSVAVGETECEEGDPEQPRTQHNTKPLHINTSDRVCDLCAAPHTEGTEYDHEHSSLRTLEWFASMPHRSLSTQQYGAVTTAGRDMLLPSKVSSEAELARLSPLTCLYWQQVVSAIAPGCVSGRKVVMLYQFCTSGGHCKWLSNPSYLRHYNVDRWPVFQMATSREQQYSLGATFTVIFIACVTEELARGGRRSLGDVFAEAEGRYWQQHPVMKRMNNEAQSASDRFGDLVVAKGDRSDIAETPIADIFKNSLQEGMDGRL